MTEERENRIFLGCQVCRWCYTLMELVLVLFCARGDVGVWVREHANKAGCDLVVDYGLAAFSRDVDNKFLLKT
jgi:hypothetical protein